MEYLEFELPIKELEDQLQKCQIIGDESDVDVTETCQQIEKKLEETKSILKQYLELQEYKHMIEEDANQPWYLYFKNNSNSFPTCENIKDWGECPMKGQGACKERILFGANGVK